MTNGKPHVLHLEDESETTSAIVDRLKALPALVTTARDVAEAEARAVTEQFDLLLVDLRVPRSGKYGAHDEGQEFLARLKSGDCGAQNIDVPFVILTAFLQDVKYEKVAALPGFCGVISKSAPVLRDLVSRLSPLCPWIAGVIADQDADYIVEDLLIFPSPADDSGSYEVVVPSWPNGETISVPATDLTDALRQELDFGVRPVFAWALVNIAAGRSEFVRPHRWKVSAPAQDKIASFDARNAD